MLYQILLVFFLIQFLVILGVLLFAIFFARPEVPLAGNDPLNGPRMMLVKSARLGARGNLQLPGRMPRGIQACAGASSCRSGLQHSLPSHVRPARGYI